MQESKTDSTIPINRRTGVDLSRFYIRSGVRENCFCEKNPKYRMGSLPTSEARERANLRGTRFA